MALRLLNILNRSQSIILQVQVSKGLCTNSSSTIPKNVLEEFVTAQHQPDNGTVYDKKPFKIFLEAGKRYSWCLCGRSHKQPFCDGIHKNEQLKITLKPIKFAVEESKEYWLCNCKHTKNRPFCDGSHKSKVVQEKNSVIKQ